MTEKALTRLGICEAIYKHIGLSRKDSLDIVQNILEKKAIALANGEDVKLSSFGSFLIKRKKPRTGRNPKTKVEAVISERNVVVFRPSMQLKNKVNSN
jgi:integration host factor subunit alpha